MKAWQGAPSREMLPLTATVPPLENEDLIVPYCQSPERSAYKSGSADWKKRERPNPTDIPQRGFNASRGIFVRNYDVMRGSWLLHQHYCKNGRQVRHPTILRFLVPAFASSPAQNRRSNIYESAVRTSFQGFQQAAGGRAFLFQGSRGGVGKPFEIFAMPPYNSLLLTRRRTHLIKEHVSRAKKCCGEAKYSK